MKFLRLLACAALLIILIWATVPACVDNCSKNVDADENSGLAIQQALPERGK
jgi:hypothetical protein